MKYILWLFVLLFITPLANASNIAMVRVVVPQGNWALSNLTLQGAATGCNASINSDFEYVNTDVLNLISTCRYTPGITYSTINWAFSFNLDGMVAGKPSSCEITIAPTCKTSGGFIFGRIQITACTANNISITNGNNGTCLLQYNSQTPVANNLDVNFESILN